MKTLSERLLKVAEDCMCGGLPDADNDPPEIPRRGEPVDGEAAAGDTADRGGDDDLFDIDGVESGDGDLT